MASLCALGVFVGAGAEQRSARERNAQFHCAPALIWPRRVRLARSAFGLRQCDCRFCAVGAALRSGGSLAAPPSFQSGSWGYRSPKAPLAQTACRVVPRLWRVIRSPGWGLPYPYDFLSWIGPARGACAEQRSAIDRNAQFHCAPAGRDASAWRGKSPRSGER